MRPLGAGREITPGTTVLEHLARSNRLDVYDAYNEPRACRVIVKTLRPDKLAVPGHRRALLREGLLLRRLTHPHVVRGYEVHDLARPAIVMETLAGETLDHLLDGPPLRAAELAHLGCHLASALRYLHGEGVLHLDLKPSNVVAERGRAKLIDLSHARAPGRMRAGNGTWCYMAPEQARGGDVGPAADVWGLGIVLWCAATGGSPLEDIADELDVDDPQLHGRVPSVRAVRRGLPRALSGLVDACVEPDVADRPRLDEALAVLVGLAG